MGISRTDAFRVSRNLRKVRYQYRWNLSASKKGFSSAGKYGNHFSWVQTRKVASAAIDHGGPTDWCYAA